jgi:hypothetical protein
MVMMFITETDQTFSFDALLAFSFCFTATLDHDEYEPTFPERVFPST